VAKIHGYEEDPIQRQQRLVMARHTKLTKKRESLARRAGGPVNADYGTLLQYSKDTHREREIEIDGVRQAVFAIGAVARVLGKSVSTVRIWERTGVIPATPYRGPSDERLYTFSQVESLRKSLLTKGRILPSGRPRLKPPTEMAGVIQYADGRVEKKVLYPIQSLADLLGCVTPWLRKLERGGFFPASPLRAKARRDRVYTAEMMVAIKVCLERLGYPKLSLNGVDPVTLCLAVEAAWREQGIMTATLLKLDASPGRSAFMRRQHDAVKARKAQEAQEVKKP